MPQPSHHLLPYYDAMTVVYTDASAIGFPVSHIAEFYLNLWWNEFGLWHVVPVEECFA